MSLDKYLQVKKVVLANYEGEGEREGKEEYTVVKAVKNGIYKGTYDYSTYSTRFKSLEIHIYI